MRNKLLSKVTGKAVFISGEIIFMTAFIVATVFGVKVSATTYVEGLPFDGYVTSGSVTLTCNKDKGVEVLKVNNEAVTSTKTFNEEGEYNVEVLNKDGEQLDVIDFVIDKTAPSIVGVSNGGTYKGDVSIDVNDLTSVTGTLNGSKLTDSDIESGIECDKTGKYTLVLRDEAGNTTTVNFTVDATKPSIKGVKSGKYYKKSVKVKFSDKDSGIKKATLNGKTIKSGKKVSKTGKYTVKVYDKAGNCTTSKFYIDKVKPKIKKKEKWGMTTVTYSDNFGLKAIKSVTVNGEKVKYYQRGYISVTSNNVGTKTVVVTDRAGNKTKIKVK